MGLSITPSADRSHILTEQNNPRSRALDALSVAECIALIHEEDAAVIDALRQARASIVAFTQAICPGFVAGGRLIYFGAGTSGRLGVLDASEAPPTFQVPPGRIVGIIAGGDGALRLSSEGKEDDAQGVRAELERLNLTPRDAVLGIAAGGTTPYVVGGMSVAKMLCAGVTTGMLTCTPIERPSDADHLIVLATGAEVLTGSTRMKAGSATKMALNAISTTLMVQSGRVYENLMVDVRASNAKLVDRAARIVITLTGIDRQRAISLLGEAGGSVKVAVVMHTLGLPAAAAETRLELAAGRLRVALASAKPPLAQ